MDIAYYVLRLKKNKTSDTINRYIESRDDHNTAIFVTAKQPHKMSVVQMRYIIKRISNRAEIKKRDSLTLT